jgi:hypothetical protein
VALDIVSVLDFDSFERDLPVQFAVECDIDFTKSPTIVQT